MPNAVPTKTGHTTDFIQPELDMVAGHSQATQGTADPTREQAA